MGLLFPDDAFHDHPDDHKPVPAPAPVPDDDAPPPIDDVDTVKHPSWYPGDARHMVMVFDRNRAPGAAEVAVGLPPVDPEGAGYGVYDVSTEEGLSRLAMLQPNRITYIPGSRMAYTIQRHPAILRRFRIAYVFDLDGSAFMRFMESRFGNLMRFEPASGGALAFSYARVTPAPLPYF